MTFSLSFPLALIVHGLLAFGCAGQDIDFTTWFLENGGVVGNIELGTFEGMGRGVKSRSNIKEGDMLLNIPSKLIFSLASMQDSKNPVHNCFAKELSSQSDLAVAAAVVHEKLMGSKSFFAPYISVLPAYIPSLSHFTEQELIELQNEDISKNSIQNHKTQESEFKALKKKFGICTAPELNNLLTEEIFVWSKTIVDSRGLRFRGKVYLAPYADMFNYQPLHDLREAEGGESYLKHHKLEDGALTILADRDESSGRQIFEDYGDNSNDIYIQYHGFVPHENPFHCVFIAAPPMDELVHSKRDFLKKLNFKAAPRACVRSQGVLPLALQVYLAALVFTEDEIKSCVAVMIDAGKRKGGWQQIADGCGFTAVSEGFRAVVENNEAPHGNQSLPSRAIKSIQSFLVSAEPVWPTSIAEDERLLQGQGLRGPDSLSDQSKHTVHMDLALRYRLKNKDLWKSILLRFGVGVGQETDGETAPGGEAEASVPQQVEIKVDGLGHSSSDTTASSAATTTATEVDTQTGNEASTPTLPEPRFGFEDVSDTGLTLDQKLAQFNEWFEKAAPAPSFLTAVSMPIYRVGTIANTDITKGSAYLGVPLEVIMDSDKAFADDHVGQLLRNLTQAFNAREDMHELLFFLLQERLDKKSQSRFWPYLRLLPKPGEVDVPVYWTVEQVEERLGPSAVKDMVLRYKDGIRRQFETVTAYELVSKFFPPELLSFDNYLWATSILDSRSIWWEGKRHLVPMLDFINCIEGPDPDSIHSTSRSGNIAITLAPWSFREGEQVFENYGQPNHIYFMYHGFVLDESSGGNTHDCVQMELSVTDNELKALDLEKAKAHARKFGLRSMTKLSFCLDPDAIPENVWLFLSFKKANEMNKVVKAKNNTLQVTRFTVSLLLDAVSLRLKGYEGFTTSHEMSQRLLDAERNILEKAKALLSTKAL